MNSIGMNIICSNQTFCISNILGQKSNGVKKDRTEVSLKERPVTKSFLQHKYIYITWSQDPVKSNQKYIEVIPEQGGEDDKQDSQ